MTLIEKLEAAQAGSRELNRAICTELGLCPQLACNRCTLVCYEYTQSLDACLPNERIRFSMLLGDGRYEAEAIDRNGEYHKAEAATEALARRAAALKARQ